MNETYATGFVNPKTTALFFDKLYIPEKLVSSGYGFEHGYFLIPNEVRFFYNNELDDWYSYAYKICSSRNSCITYPEAFNLPEYSFSSANIISIRDIEEAKLSKKVKQRLKDKYNACGEFHLSVFRNEFLQLVAQEIKKNLNINLVPKDEETNAEIFFTCDGVRFVRTGDIGYTDEDGRLFFFGRKKRMFKISGVPVFPSEIENAVLALNIIKNALAVYKNKIIVLYIELNKEIDEATAVTAIEDVCKKSLIMYARPSKIAFVQRWERNSVGKITGVVEIKSLYSLLLD